MDELATVAEEEYNFISAKELAKLAKKYGLRLEDENTDEPSPRKVDVINSVLKSETQKAVAGAMLDAEWNRSMIVRAENYKIAKRKRRRVSKDHK